MDKCVLGIDLGTSSVKIVKKCKLVASKWQDSPFVTQEKRAEAIFICLWSEILLFLNINLVWCVPLPVAGWRRS